MTTNTKRFAAAVVGILGLVCAREANAQLVAGDVAIVGFRSDTTKGFAFVALRDIAEGTVISFTDNGWLAAGNFRPNEGVYNYTVAAGGLTAGTVVAVSAPSGVSFSVDGDQIFAFQGTIEQTTGVLNGTLLYGLNDNGAGVWQADATSPNNSALPAALANANVALPELDNYAYTGTTTGTRAELLAAIANPANWTGDDTTQPAFPTAFTVTGAAVDLLAFTAARTAAGVALAWQTGAETNCGIFTVGRCDRSAGACDTIAAHADLAGITVACHNDLAGGTYAVIDATAGAGAVYSYVLREHETTGGVTSHGPIVVTADAANAAAAAPAAEGFGANSAAQGCAAAGAGAGWTSLLLLGAVIALRRRRRN